ncbi:MAG: ribonuclease P protein component [Rickettsiales bacterium]|nr:ribonuclease P protein component [Rickettsiales bacterium]
MKGTIKSHEDFHLPEDTPVVRMNSFVVKYVPKRYETGQYGLVVPKKVFPLATLRNRIKRKLREWLRSEPLPADKDCIIIARTAIVATTDGAHQMRRAGKGIAEGRADIIVRKEPQGRRKKMTKKRRIFARG